MSNKYKNTTKQINWSDLNIDPRIAQSIDDLNFKKPTLIQAKLIKIMNKGNVDIIAASETGSGKTFAFGVPLITNCLKTRSKTDTNILSKRTRRTKSPCLSDDSQEGEIDLNSIFLNDACEHSTLDPQHVQEEETGDCVKVIKNISIDLEGPAAKKQKKCSDVSYTLSGLVLAPTRDLAIQIKQDLARLAANTDVKIVAIVGGLSVQKQTRLLKSYPDIIIATPGRLWDIMSTNSFFESILSRVNFLVVDEADKMAESGFFVELEKIFQFLNKDKEHVRRNVLVSATLGIVDSKKNKHLKKLIKFIGLSNKRRVVDLTDQSTSVVSTVSEFFVKATCDEKDVYLAYFLYTVEGRSIVFSNSKNCTYRLVNLLKMMMFDKVFSLHSSMPQKKRLLNIEKFKGADNSVLISTDIASRGLDVTEVKNIIHYECPRNIQSYIHRTGRSGRCGKLGQSILLCSPKEINIFNILSKRKDEMKNAKIDSKIYCTLRPIIKMAKRMEVDEYKNTKSNRNDKWLEKLALEADIDYNNSDPNLSDSEKGGKIPNKNRTKKKKRNPNMDNFLNSILEFKKTYLNIIY